MADDLTDMLRSIPALMAKMDRESPSPPTRQQRRQSEKVAPGRKFVSSKVMLDQVARILAASGNGSGAALAVWLSVRSWCDTAKTRSVRYSPEIYERIGLQRHTGHRALRLLESEGFISIERKGRTFTTITLLIGPTD